MAFADNDGAGKKRIAIIGVSSFLLVAMVVAVTVGVNTTSEGGSSDDTRDGNKSNEVTTTTKAIKAICQPTDYKQECVNSLKSDAKNTTDPQELIKIAFKATMEKIQEGAKNSTMLQELEKDPRAQKALDQCKELLNQSAGELQRSFDKMGDFDFSKLDEVIMDLKTWLSAAITYQETCLDGFQNTTGEAGNKMRKALKISMELSSNGLAIISETHRVLTEMNLGETGGAGAGSGGRRLFSEDDDDDDDKIHVMGEDGLPAWVKPGTRRLLAAQPSRLKPNLVVAKDGSGQFKTITEALNHVPKRNNNTFVIYIKEGVYHEYVMVFNNMTHVMFIGDGGNKTRITGNKNWVDGTPTMRTATVSILGDHFIAKNMGFENSAGAQKHQAVALRVQSDMSVFYNCSMDGYQDTLYTHAKRQFYRDCTVSGTIDFVFGDAAVVFQNCKFVVRKPEHNQNCIVTAQGRKDKRQSTGTVLQNCTIVSDKDYYSVRFQNKGYLGRPWKEYSRTIIMDSFLDDLVQPDGWMPWNGTFGLDTCWYAEYNNRGPGSDKSKRVTWAGVKTITQHQVHEFTPSRFLYGDNWIKSSGVPHIAGLTHSAGGKKAT